MSNFDKTLMVDYTFGFGKYKNQNETVDTNNYEYKLNALLNIMHMVPGTLQDNPYIGIDTSGLQFVEGEDVDYELSRIRGSIQTQADQYIDHGFVSSIETDISDDTGELGSKKVTFRIILNGERGVLVTSAVTPKGLKFHSLKPLDTTAFV